MEFISGFKWAVPKAFNDAITQCKFEVGDTLYDTPKAYEQWSTALKHLEYGIEIKSSKSLPKSILSTFADNWNASLEIELTYFKKGKKKDVIKTTNSRLFSCIWHGDIRVLNPHSPEPDAPILLRDVTKKLEEIESKLRKLIGPGRTFVMVYDSTNSISKEKRTKLFDNLKIAGDLSLNEYSPLKLKMIDAEKILPTISILCFTSNGSESEVREALQQALYTSALNQKSSRFRIRTHGLYFEEGNLNEVKDTSQKLF